MNAPDTVILERNLPPTQASGAMTVERASAAAAVEPNDDLLLPRLELRVGITGHRPPRFAAEHRAAIEHDLAAMFAMIRETLDAIHREHRACFAPCPPCLVLVSPLAAGADSLASEVALSNGATLEACLPFGVETYEDDFEGEDRALFHRLLAAAARTLILPGEEESREEAYRAVGLLTAAQSDILLAIWDGEPAQGIGGTPAIVADAVASGLPVVVIDARSRTPPRLLWNIDDDQSHDAPTVETVASSGAAESLPRLIRRLVVPPERSLDLLHDLASASDRDWRRSIGYPTLLVATGARSIRRAFQRDTLEQSVAQLTSLQRAPAQPQHDAQALASAKKLSSRFAAADMCANRFALRYRGGFITNFAMSALAVCLAMLGLLLPALKTLFVIAELLTIAVIVIRTREANRLAWHRRWLDARHLAELLRLLPLAAALGDLTLLRHGGDRAIGSHGWYARATAREVGMSEGRIDEARLTMVRDEALSLIDGQVRYHRANAKQMNLMDHRLRMAGEFLFVATIIACAMWLLAAAFGVERSRVLGVDFTSAIIFVSVLLPAIGAALYGIRTQGDFCALAVRSQLIVEQLGKLDKAIRRDALNHRRVIERLRRLHGIMLAEVDQWRQSSEHRPIELPG